MRGTSCCRPPVTAGIPAGVGVFTWKYAFGVGGARSLCPCLLQTKGPHVVQSRKVQDTYLRASGARVGTLLLHVTFPAHVGIQAVSTYLDLHILQVVLCPPGSANAEHAQSWGKCESCTAGGGVLGRNVGAL